VSWKQTTNRFTNRGPVESYVHYVDHRDPAGQMEFFTADILFVVYMNIENLTPSMALHSRKSCGCSVGELQ